LPKGAPEKEGRSVEEFMKGDHTGQLMLRDAVTRSVAIRSNTATGGLMLSDEEIFRLTSYAFFDFEPSEFAAPRNSFSIT
jgi:hypothetical protein